MKLRIIGTVGISEEQVVGAFLRLLVVTLRIVDLRDVIRYGLGVRRFVLQRLQSRQGLVITLQFVHTVGVVIRSAYLVPAVPFAQMAEEERSTQVLLHHEIGVSAVELVVVLMRTAQFLGFHRLQYLQRLFVMPFLHLKHALHELHLIRKRGIRESLQVRFEIAL